MGHQRLRVILAMVGLLALALPFITAADGVITAADGADDPPAPGEGVGDASAGLVGAALQVDDPDGLTAGVLGGLLGDLDALEALDTGLDLALLDGLTSATTREEPDARASMSPLRMGSERPHDVEAGPGESHGSEAIGLPGVSALLSGLDVSPFAVSADADEDGALALIDAVTASLDVLGDGGMDVGLTEVRSEVTRTDATGDQDLVVEDLSIALGDLLPAELLALLPLDSLLDLLEELGLDDGLRDAVDDAVDDVTGLLDDADLDVSLLDEVDTDLLGQLQLLQGLEADLEDAADPLATVVDDLESLVDALAGGLLSGITGDSSLGDVLAELDGEDADDLEDAEAQVAEVLATLAALDDAGIDVADCPTEAGDTLTDLLATTTDLITCLPDVLDALGAAIEDLIADIAGDIDGLEDALTALTALLADLEDALDGLLGLVDDVLDRADGVADLELLGADRLDLEVAAVADAEGGATRVVCELGGLAVLGESLGSASCDDGELTGPALDAVGGAVTLVEDVLEALPGVGSAGGVSLELLPQAQESVTTADDGTVTASAMAVLLELGVPSLTIDPAEAVDDLLDVGGLPGELGGLDAELDDLLGLLGDAGLADLLDDADGLVDGVTAQLGDVTGLLGDLDLPVLSQAVTTPAIDLVLDPVSEATFTADETPVPDDGDPEPSDPTPDDGDPEPSGPAPTSPRGAPDTTPDLPRTGGAFPLLGLLALAGAAGLRRTG